MSGGLIGEMSYPKQFIYMSLGYVDPFFVNRGILPLPFLFVLTLKKAYNIINISVHKMDRCQRDAFLWVM